MEALIILFLTSCAMRLPGVYAPTKKSSINSTVLKINNDSTFSYSLFSELQNDTFIGNWRIIKDTLSLKIASPFHDDSLIKREAVVSRFNSSIDSGKIKIKILVQDSVPFTIAKVYINNNKSPVTLDNLGQAIIGGRVDSIRVRYQGIKPRLFNINSQVNNDFTLFLYDKAFIPLDYLTPIRKWLIDNGRLIPLNENNTPFENEVYRKQ